MNVRTEGEGFPVVFLHGWGGSIDSFAFVAASIKRGYRSVRVDLPGFGASPAPECVWGSEDYADAVFFELEQIGIKNAVFVCHSFGGRVGIMLAVRHPEIVGGLVLVDSAGIRPKLSKRRARAIARYKRAKERGKTPKNAGSKDYRALSAEMRGTFVRIVNEDLSGVLGSVRAPTLIVWGDRDRDTPVAMAHRLRDGIEGSSLITLPGGHFCYLDAPYTFVRILGEFTLEVSGRGAVTE